MRWETDVTPGVHAHVRSEQGAVVRRRADAPWWTVRSTQALARWHAFLRVVRQVVGAPDYERYLEHHARCHGGTPPLDRRAFYAEFVSWRFGAGPTRCC